MCINNVNIEHTPMLENTYNLYYSSMGFYISDKIRYLSYKYPTVELIYNVKNAYTLIKYKIGPPEFICDDKLCNVEIVATYATWGRMAKRLRKLQNIKDGYNYTWTSPHKN